MSQALLTLSAFQALENDLLDGAISQQRMIFGENVLFHSATFEQWIERRLFQFSIYNVDLFCDLEESTAAETIDMIRYLLQTPKYAPRAEAFVWHSLAHLYAASDSEKALAYYMRTLRYLACLGETDSDDAAVIWLSCAALYAEQGDLVAAEHCFEQADHINDRLVQELSAEESPTAMLYGNWANFCRKQGAHDKALTILRKGLALETDDFARVHLLNQLGDLYQATNAAEEAAYCFAEAKRLSSTM